MRGCGAIKGMTQIGWFREVCSWRFVSDLWSFKRRGARGFNRELLENVVLVDLCRLVLGLQRRWFV